MTTRLAGYILCSALALPAIDAARIKQAVEATTATTHCCCKVGPCGSAERSSNNGFYWPEQNTCCKFLDGCGNSLVNFFSQNDFDKDSPKTMCAEDSKGSSDLPGWQLPGSVPQIDVDSLQTGSTAHTIHSHCQKLEASAQVDEQPASQAVSALTHELEKNNVLSLTRDLFTMYACIRWAPDMSYLPLARDEINNGQVPANSGTAEGNPVLLMARAVERGNFIPLRCTENIGVYDKKDETGAAYPAFENRLHSMADFFSQEMDGAFDARAKFVEGRRPFEGFWTSGDTKRDRWYGVLNETKLFSGPEIAKRHQECLGTGGRLFDIDVHKASADQLWASCAFINWWAPKVSMYLQRFPFQAFLAGNTGGSITEGKRVLLCFGKRVSGELHRRPQGSHILTDMNGVGCHGFWSYDKAGEMLQHIVDLWAPPTCQLTFLELKMKSRMLEMFSEMNKKLFETLPALIASEEFSGANPSAKEATGATALLAGGTWAAGKMTGILNTYQTLGKIMSDSVMKWSVCPVGNATGLDAKLGSDDLVAQKYTHESYSQWGGKQPALPGETCTALPTAGREKCSIGPVREDYPEKYKNVQFACPALPPLPAGDQLKVIKEKHTGKCVVKATPDQLVAKTWPYTGVRPTEVQYPPREYTPTEQMERVTIMDRRTRLDEYGIARDFATLGRACTLEVAAQYPRWCSKPEVLSASSGIASAAAALGGVAESLSGLASIFDNNDRNGWASWAYKQSLGAGVKVGNTLGSLTVAAISGLSSKVRNRYNRISRDRIYDSVEAGEALWAMAYQTAEGGGGSRQQFDRWVMTVPCEGVDVAAEVESEFTWGEVALELLEKAVSRSGAILLQNSVQLGLRSEVELHAGDNLRREHHLAWRGHGSSAPWTVSYDNGLVHSRQNFDITDSAYSSKMPEAYGLDLSYSCGPRKAMYDGVTSELGFEACVKAGVNQAQARNKASSKDEAQIAQLRQQLDSEKEALEELQKASDAADESAQDEAQARVDAKVAAMQAKEELLSELSRDRLMTLQEYDEEIVVRVDFSALPQCEFFSGALDAVALAASEKGGNATYVERSNAQAAAAMGRRGSGCATASHDGSSVTPTPYKDASPRSGIVGAYKGASAPHNTRKEVILSAVDVYAWLEN